MDAREVETELAETAPQKSKGPWPLILIVAVLTLIAVWLVPTQEDDMPPATAEDQPPSLLDEAATAPALTEPEAAPVIDDRPGAMARALIAEMRASGEIDLDKITEAATKAQAAGEFPDAYLLYFFAAREGHADAALALGRQADPATHAEGTGVFESPDAIQAHKWYRVAAENGSQAGRDALAALREKVELLAADGDPEAQRISLMWQ